MTTQFETIALLASINPVPQPALVDPEVRERTLARILDQIDAAAAPRRGLRPLAVAALMVGLTAVGAGVAIADNAISFDGIAAFVGLSSANHVQTTQDVINLAVIERMNANRARMAAAMGVPASTLLPHTARFLTEVPSGTRVYVISTTTNELCVLTQPPTAQAHDLTGTIGCAAPTGQAQPTTIGRLDLIGNGPDATPPLTYGVAQNDVTAVSFMANGSEQTVPVDDNVWAYEGDNSALESITVHYANGTTRTINR